MSSVSLINRVKYSKTLYAIYSRIGSFAIKVIKLFVKTQDNLIVFASFGGKKYDDSPKAIFEAMISDKRFDKFEIVWAFINPSAYSIERAKKIKIDTIRYYLTLLKARVWITNSGMTRGLDFTGKNTLQINTWHGTPIKRMGADIASSNQSFKPKFKKFTDIMLAQGQFEVDIFSRVYHIEESSFRIIGLPRNDELFNKNTIEYRRRLKDRFGIPRDKKVILYAPTFREYEKDDNNGCILKMPINIELWKKEIGDRYVLFIRAHYEVVNSMNLKDDEFVHNVSSYPQLNDLILLSDILISDYSSIFFDYSITGRPMLSYAYDYNRYEKERGMYFDIREELQCQGIDNELALLESIKSINIDERQRITEVFRKKYVQVYGNASTKSLDLVLDELMK